MGGYAVDGGRVRRGLVFRSDSLARLDQADQDRLAEMGLKTVVDFRSTDETERSPDQLPDSVTYVPLPIQSGEMNFVAALERLKKGDSAWLTPGYMIRGYLRNLDEYPHVWAEVFGRLADSGNLPLLFHCTGGKDRAGTFAALLLLVLGADRDTVIRDHQLSNPAIKPMLGRIDAMMESYGIDPNVVRPYFRAPIEAIEALLDHLESTYGSAREYLTGPGKLPPGCFGPGQGPVVGITNRAGRFRGGDFAAALPLGRATPLFAYKKFALSLSRFS